LKRSYFVANLKYWSSTNIRLMFSWYNLKHGFRLHLYALAADYLQQSQNGGERDIKKLYFDYFGLISINKWWTTEIFAQLKNSLQQNKDWNGFIAIAITLNSRVEKQLPAKQGLKLTQIWLYKPWSPLHRWNTESGKTRITFCKLDIF